MKKKILFVDDESDFLSGVRRSLKKYNNEWELFFANSVDEALEVDEIDSLDVVISDLGMPGKDGFKFLEMFRSNEDTKNIPVLVMSGIKQNKAKNRAYELGATEFLKKPFSSEDLIQAIKNSIKLKSHLDQNEKNRQLFEKKFNERNNKLERDIIKFQKKKEVSEEALRLENEFLANMSHELRTPLNSIIGFSQLVEEVVEENDIDQITHDLKTIQLAGKHMLTLVNDILEVAKIESRKMDLIKKEIQLAPFILEMTPLVQTIMKENGNEFKQVFLNNLGNIETDDVRLRQILFNLLSNAAKFTKDGTVTLQASRENYCDRDWIKFEIKDTGIGLSDKQIKHIFDKFSQADPATSKKFGGTGLGLSITKKLCQLMSGDVFVESEVGRGAIFTVMLPATELEIKYKNPSLLVREN